MRIASGADIKARFSSFLKESTKGPVVVTRNGRPVAVLLSIEDEDEVERLLLAYSPRMQALLRAAREEIRERGIAHDIFWDDVEKEKEV